jgi:hypothetical protein
LRIEFSSLTFLKGPPRALDIGGEGLANLFAGSSGKDHMLLLLIVLLLLFGGGGGYYGYGRWGYGGGAGIGLGTVLLIVLVFYLLGGLPALRS